MNPSSVSLTSGSNPPTSNLERPRKLYGTLHYLSSHLSALEPQQSYQAIQARHCNSLQRKQATSMPSFWRSIPAILLVPATIQAITLDCTHIREEEQSWNFEKLGGKKVVHHQEWRRPTVHNTSIAINICKPLPKETDLPEEDRCPDGTWICATEYLYRNGMDPFIGAVRPIAGRYPNRGMDPKFTRLKNSAGNSDEKEGLIMELHGAKYGSGGDARPQKAIIEFLCDKGVSGNEGFNNKMALDGVEYGGMERIADNNDNDGPDLPNLDEGKSLQVKSFKEEDEHDVLRLQWKTKFACEDAMKGGDGGGSKSGGWGFFTWFIIILFLLAASYIIFGSWLNYNRYGARGWDLIPHGDTIRDIPYIVKEWGSNAADRLKGGDTRGGYSAV